MSDYKFAKEIRINQADRFIQDKYRNIVSEQFHKDKFGFHLNVDVNYDIFWGEYEGKHCSIDEFLSDTVDIFGQ